MPSPRRPSEREIRERQAALEAELLTSEQQRILDEHRARSEGKNDVPRLGGRRDDILEWAKRAAPNLLSQFVSRLESAEVFHTITVALDGPDDEPSITSIPQLDTRSMSLPEIFKRFDRASAHSPKRVVMNIFRALDRNEDGNYPAWIMGVDSKTGERFVLGTALTDTDAGPRIFEPNEIDEAMLAELLSSWEFPPDEEGAPLPAPPTTEEISELVERSRAGEDVGDELGAALARQAPPEDTEGMNQTEALAHISAQLHHILSDALEKITGWVDAHAEVTGADLEDTLMVDRGATWGHEQVPPPRSAAISLRERLFQLREHMQGLDSPTTLARFRHRESNYLLALYKDPRFDSGSLVKVSIHDGHIQTENLDLAAALE